VRRLLNGNSYRRRISKNYPTSNADLATAPNETCLLLDPRHKSLGQPCEISCNQQLPRETDRRPSKPEFVNWLREDRDVQKLFDLISEDDWLNVYRGELEVRPPCAPTTRQVGRPILDWTADSQILGDFSLRFLRKPRADSRNRVSNPRDVPT